MDESEDFITSDGSDDHGTRLMQQSAGGPPISNAKHIGVMLTDDGLGDQSFNDSSFKGLEKARDELGIEFDYREIAETDTYEQGLTELVKDGNDLIIGVGFSMQEDLEKVAKNIRKSNFYSLMLCLN